MVFIPSSYGFLDIFEQKQPHGCLLIFSKLTGPICFNRFEASDYLFVSKVDTYIIYTYKLSKYDFRNTVENKFVDLFLYSAANVG